MAFNGGSSSLKFFKRLNIYKNSTKTVSFDPVTLEAWSYNWKFASKIDGVLVFNDYNWSVTTSAHQSAVKSVLRELGIKYIILDAGSERPENFSKETSRFLYRKYCDLSIKTQYLEREKESGAQRWRKVDLESKLINLEKLEALSPRFKLSAKDKKEIYAASEENFFNDLNEGLAEKTEKFLKLQDAAQNTEELTVF